MGLETPAPGKVLPLADADAAGVNEILRRQGGLDGRNPKPVAWVSRKGVERPIDAETPGQQPRASRHPGWLTGDGHRPQQHPISPVSPPGHHIHAVVNAIAHIDIKPPRLTKQRFVAGGAAAVAVTGGVVLGIRLRFHNHAPEQLATFLAFHQQAADELGGNLLGGAGEEGLGEVLGGRGGYGSGFLGARLLNISQACSE